MRTFEWPWCLRHDAPYVARQDGLYCPWSEFCGHPTVLALGEAPPTVVTVTHTGKTYNKSLRFGRDDAAS